MILAEREKNDREQNVTATQLAGVIIAFWRVNTNALPGCLPVTATTNAEFQRANEAWLSDPRRPYVDAKVKAILARGNGYRASEPDPMCGAASGRGGKCHP